MSNTLRTILAVLLAVALALVAYPFVFAFITPHLLTLALGKGAFATIVAILFGGWLLLMVADILNTATASLLKDNIVAKILQSVIYVGGFVFCTINMVPRLAFAGFWSVIASIALLVMLTTVYYKGTVSAPWIKA